MTPVARVTYQSGLTVPVTAQEPPDDVTGAAGVLDGGRGGGASGLLAALGRRLAGVLGWLLADALGRLLAGVLSWLLAGTPGWLTAGPDARA